MLFGIILVKESEYSEYMYHHEMVHVRQFKANPILFYPRWLFSKRWRLIYELEAYRESIKHGRSVESAALSLAGKTYDNMITYTDALKALRGY